MILLVIFRMWVATKVHNFFGGHLVKGQLFDFKNMVARSSFSKKNQLVLFWRQLNWLLMGLNLDWKPFQPWLHQWLHPASLRHLYNQIWVCAKVSKVAQLLNLISSLSCCWNRLAYTMRLTISQESEIWSENLNKLSKSD